MLDEPTTAPPADAQTTPPTPAFEPLTGRQPPKRNQLAIVAFILSFFFGTIGAIMGLLALRQIKRSGERGRRLAISAIVIGAVNLMAALVIGLLAVIFVASTDVSGSVAVSARNESPGTSTTS